MKAFEIMNEIIGAEFTAAHPDTVDTLKAGDPNKEVAKIGVCFIATPEVLAAAADWGADLLITHEPTFYNHPDRHGDDPLTKEKEELVAKTGMTIYRYHDSLHAKPVDIIDRALLDAVGWKGTARGKTFVLDEPKTPLELARDLQEKLPVQHPRIVGRRDGQVREIFLALGAWGNAPYTEFRQSDAQLLISGELCEWYDCEPIRDMAQMGHQKTLLVLGHAASERAGLRALAKELDGRYGQAKYFECGEIFSYPEE